MNNEYLNNGDFSVLNPTSAYGWEAQGGKWEGAVSIVTDSARGYAVRLYAEDNRDPWIRQYVKLPTGAKYRISADLKTLSLEGKARFKLEFYRDEKGKGRVYLCQSDLPVFKPTDGKWERVSAEFVMPEGTEYVCIYPRLYGKGEIFYADIKVEAITDAPYLHTGNDAFVYTDTEYAECYAKFNTSAYTSDGDEVVRFTLLDGDTVLDTFEETVNQCNIYRFKSSLLAEKAREYTVKTQYIKGGAAIETHTDPIYRYDRPARLTKDGLFITPSGEAVRMSMAYHASTDSFAELARLGINGVQINATGELSGTMKMLEALEKNGLYAFVELYGGMKPAAHPRNIQHTIEVVNAVKNHPTVMGYMVMDEPFLNDLENYPYIRDSYKLFRDLDPEKPVYMVECERMWLYKAVTTCDIFAVDPYPSSQPHLKHISGFNSIARDVNRQKKPLMHIIQTYKLGGWEPKPQDIRHMAYQALFTGADSIGFYPISDEGGLLQGDAAQRKDFLYKGVEYFMLNEYADARKAFATGEYTEVSVMCHDDYPVWHKMYIKDDVLYAVLLNRTDREQKLSLRVPDMGELVAAGDDLIPRENVHGNGFLNLTLNGEDIVRYKIMKKQ